MGQRIEHDAAELRAWKLRTVFLGVWYTAMLVVCVPLTLYVGYEGIAAVLNGIRDWWHYQPHEGPSNFWLGVGALVVGGLGWMYALYALEDYREDRRFNEFVRSRRMERERFEAERLRPKTKWEKGKAAIGLVYLGLMGCGLLAVIFGELMK